jgi:hypothetical protein
VLNYTQRNEDDGGMDIQIHVLLTSAVTEGEWPASCSWLFIRRGKEPRYPLHRWRDGPQSRSGRYGEVKILDLAGNRTPTPQSSSPQPVAIPTALPRLPEGNLCEKK